MVSYSLLSVWTSRHLLLGFESHVDDGASGEEWGMDLGLEREGKNQGHEFDHSIFFLLFLYFIHSLPSDPSTERFVQNNAKSMAFTKAC